MWAPVEDAKAVGHMLISSWLNLLLVFLPIGVWAGLSGGDPTLVFTAVSSHLKSPSPAANRF